MKKIIFVLGPCSSQVVQYPRPGPVHTPLPPAVPPATGAVQEAVVSAALHTSLEARHLVPQLPASPFHHLDVQAGQLSLHLQQLLEALGQVTVGRRGQNSIVS